MSKSTIGNIIENWDGSLTITVKSTGRPQLNTEETRRLLVKICK